MKRIALLAAVLSLGAGAAFAATPNTTSPTQPAENAQTQAQHHPHHMAKAQKTNAHKAKAQNINAREDRETKALNLLEAKGYTYFSNFKPDGRDYSATVAKNGHNMTVLVDPAKGQVTAQG